MPPLSCARTYLSHSFAPQDQIADGAVGTLELQDSAVTTQKLGPSAVDGERLADGAVTLSKLAAGVARELAKTVAGGGKVVGEVDEAGRVVRGAGYTSKRIATGEYTLTFSPSFSTTPVAVVSALSYGICYAHSQASSPDSVRVRCMSDLLGAAPVPANTRFTFIADTP